MKILLLADKQVGHEIAQWLISEHRGDLALVATRTRNEISLAADAACIDTCVFSSDDHLYSTLTDKKAVIDYGILAWWPKLIKRPLLTYPRHGFVNTHPSLLPYNRGKHSNFWSLVEETPFGVSLHFVEEGIDCGDVIAQTRIDYDWEDTGGTLYEKALAATVDLFKRTYPDLKKGRLRRIPQDLSQGSFHLAKELEEASFIYLDREYKARDLLNLIRARTFPGHPACRLKDKGQEYEIRIEIKKKLP